LVYLIQRLPKPFPWMSPRTQHTKSEQNGSKPGLNSGYVRNRAQRT